MKLRTTAGLLALALSNTVSAVTLTGTFTAFGGGYDMTGHVTGFQGNGPVGGRWITGHFTLDLEQAPADSAGNTVRGLYQGNGLDWVQFSFDGLNLATLSDTAMVHGDQVDLQQNTTNLYQVFSDKGLSMASTTDLTRREVRLRTNFVIHAPALLSSDALAQTVTWQEDDTNYYEYYDYGQIDLYYRLYDQQADGTVLADEYAQQRFFITALNTTLTTVPVPPAVGLLVSGLLGLAGISRRRARTA